jgi:hypothetical protein
MDEKINVIIKQFTEARCHRKTKELQLPWGGRTWEAPWPKLFQESVQKLLHEAFHLFIHCVNFHPFHNKKLIFLLHNNMDEKLI